METPFRIGFLNSFKKLKDPRSSRNSLYPAQEMLLVGLCATLSGVAGWSSFENFGKAKLPFLRTILPFKRGIPTDDTFRRFFGALDPLAFERLFRDWVKTLPPQIKGGVIAIDGKSVRRSHDNSKNMLHLVSAYATKSALVLGQEKVATKSNEITAIPNVLESLDLKGGTVTIDAMGCQHKIGNKIVEKDGNFIFALKENHKSLYDGVLKHFQDPNILENADSYCSSDKGHGRIEKRHCWVSTDVAWLHKKHRTWNEVKSVIKIRSFRTIKGKTSVEERYYISSDCASAKKTLIQFEATGE